VIFEMPKYPIPQGLSDVLTQHRTIVRKRCADGWQRLQTGECRTYAQAAKLCGVSLPQFNKWCAKYHKGDIAVLNSRRGKPLNSHL